MGSIWTRCTTDAAETSLLTNFDYPINLHKNGKNRGVQGVFWEVNILLHQELHNYHYENDQSSSTSSSSSTDEDTGDIFQQVIDNLSEQQQQKLFQKLKDKLHL